MNDATNTLIEIMAWLSQNALNLLIQSTVLILLGLLASRILRRHGSAVQSAIYRATLVTVLICPIAAVALNHLGFDGWTIQLPETTRTVMVAEPAPSVTIAPPNQPVLLPDTTNLTPPANELPVSNLDNGLEESTPSQLIVLLPSTSSGSAETALSVPPDLIMVERTISNTAWVAFYSALGLVWLLGTLLLLARLVLAYRKLALVRRHSPSATDSDQSLCGKLARSINVRAPDVRRNSLLASPCLTGITSPTILLPSEIKEPVPLKKAFAHELAHLRRHDILWNLVQRIALAVFFYQPLMWRLVYRLEQTAEEVCDDYVVRHCLDRSGYAQQLVDLAESNLLAPNMAGLGMFKNSTSMLGHRIVRILDTTRKLTTQISLPMVVGIVALTMVCATLGGFLGNGQSPLSMFASTDETGSETTEQEDEGPIIKLSGRILDSNGTAVSNAKVSVFPGVSAAFGNKNPPAYTTTASQNDGSFEVSFPRSSLILSKNGYEWAKNFCLVAVADGYGVNWIDADQLQDPAIENSEDENRIYAPVDLRLVTDKTKTMLQLIDPEGNPVSNATARITHLTRFADEDISAFYEAQTRGEAFPARSISDDLIIHGLPDYSANEMGEIEIAGLGDNRLASLEITGPGIAIRQVRVATAEAETVSVKYGSMQQLTITTYGAKSTITCEQTQPIFGRVTDRETGQPLAGVKIMSSKFAGANLGGIRILQTESDDKGRFRLTGMPKGPGNTIIAVPGDDHPYFMMRFEVPAESGLEPVELDLPLQRGVFIRGDVNDLKTGKPIAGATFSYLPFLSNEVAAASPVYEAGQFMEYQNRYMSGLDGSFQLVGLPGRGVVGLNVRFYPVGMGWEDIDDDDKEDNGHVRTFNRPITPSRSWPTAMKQVEISGTQTEYRIQFQLDPGLSIPLQITDSDDQPLVGVVASRLRSPQDYQYVTTKSVVNAAAFGPDEKRLIRFHHEDKAISCVVELDASVLDPSGALEKPIQIKLMPDSTITGKLVDGNGDAIAHGKVRCDVGGGRNFGMMLPTVITDKEGSFQIHHVPSGTHYTISVSFPGDFKGVCRRLEVAAGEHIDLGTIDVTSDQRPEPKRSLDSSPREQKQSQDNSKRHFAGTIFDPSGKPLDGANVYVMHDDWETGFGKKQIILAQTKTTPDGRYSIAWTKPSAGEFVSFPNDIVIAAFHTNFGPEWTKFESEPKNLTQDLKLSSSKSCTYQLVDIDGQPVVNATIRLTSLNHKTDASDLQLNNAEHRVVLHSDHNGRFTIDGLGARRSVSAFISGENIALKSVSLALLSKTEYEQRFNGKWKSDGNNFVADDKIVCAPGMEISGVVRDSKTRQPISGATVQCNKVFNFAMQATSSSDGTYRIAGVPITNQLSINVHPTVNQPYLKRSFYQRVETQETHKIDFDLHRGIWIEGQVTDFDTRQPVPNAIVYHFPLADNPNLGDYPEYDGKSKGPLLNKHYVTDEFGHYRMVGIPGPAVMGVRAGGALGADSDTPAANRALAMMYGNKIDDWLNRLADVNFTSDSQNNSMDFQVIRGKSIELQTVDPNGDPVSGVYVTRGNIPGTNWAGLGVMVQESRFPVMNFVPGKNRILKFISPERKLGIVEEIGLSDEHENASQPKQIQLQPFATIKFRLVDAQGDPVTGVTQFEFDSYQQSLNARTTPLDASGKMIVGNDGNNGDFVYDEIVAGTSYRVRFQPSNSSFPVFLHNELAVSPGEVIDLGTIDITSDARPAPSRTNLNQSSDSAASTNSALLQRVRGVPEQPISTASIASDTITFTGIVVDNSGKPVSGVRVHRLDHEVTTQSDGQFSLELPAELVKNRRGRPMLTATKDAYGLSFAYLNPEQTDNIEITLVDDSHPIQGRLVDTEGHPITGASVEIEMIRQLKKATIDDYLAAARKPGISLNQLPGGLVFSDDRIAPIKTSSDGSFEIRNVGSGRVVQVIIKGDTIALERAIIVTAKTGKIAVNRWSGMGVSGKTPIHGHNAKIVCEPTKPIEGIVFDVETKKPLAGIDIYSNRFANTNVGGLRDLKTTTDAEGRFQLLGMPTGDGNGITVAPNLSGENAEPYFAQNFEVPATAGLEPVKMEIGLQSGVWIRGKVTDKSTGQPIARARVKYKPYQTNKTASRLPLFTDGLIDEIGEGPLTDVDGNFQIVGLPGKAIVDVWAVKHFYPAGQGFEAIGEEQKNGNGEVQIFGFGVSKHHATAMQEVEINENEAAVVDFEIDPGKSVRIRMVDESGQPLTHVDVRKARSNIDNAFVSKTDEFDATGFLPGQERTLIFQHKQKNLGAVVHIGADMPSPVKVTLRPNSVLTAKLVDENGDAIQQSLTRFDILEVKGSFVEWLWPAKFTDENGVIERTVIPGSYRISVETPQRHYFFCKKIEIGAGEHVDLGTIDVTKRKEPTPKRTELATNFPVSKSESISSPLLQSGARGVPEQPISAHRVNNPMTPQDFIKDIPTVTSESMQKEKPPSTEKPDEVKDDHIISHQDMTIAGVVRDPDGTPVENAEVGVYLYWRIEGGYKTIDETIGKTRSDRNGNYEFTISEQVFEILESKVSRPTGGYTAHKDAIARGFVISANAPGHAPVWHRFENKKPSEALDFQLAKSNVVIDGKVVDLEGKPMSGVTVRPVMLGVLGSLFDWEIGNPVTSDTHGRFELQNIGDDRTITLELSGASIARTWVHSQTKQREPWFVDPDNAFYGVTHGFGSQPVIPVERGQSLIGRITDGQTGKPLEGVTVTTGNRERKQIVQTDADGKYRINGLVPRNAKSPPLYFTVTSPNPEYFITTIWSRDNLADDDRYTPIERDVVLNSGKIISGQLIDAKNGKGVPGTVMYYPKLDNRAAANFANFDPAIRTLSQQNRAIANDNGEFSITVVPGQGLLAARAVRNKQYETALGSANINNEADLLEYYHLPEVIRFCAFHKLNVTRDSADVVQIKLQPLTLITDSGEIVVEKNNGQMAPQDDSVSFSGIVVDLNGRAVGDAKVTHGEIKTTTGVDGSFTIKLPAEMVAKFSSGKPYISIEKDGFGRSLAQLAADDKNQQLTIVNDDHPIEGKLIDTEGNPIVGATVTVQQLRLFGKGMLDSHLSKALDQGGSLNGLPQGMGMAGLKIAPVTTDNDGRFTIRGIGSGRFAHLTISGETTAFRKAVVATSDLGNVQYEEPRANFLGDGIIHSRHPVLTCEPSQPIAGVVIDRDTKKPLAGFNVTSYGFLNDGPEHLVGQTDLKTTTDDEGRFRLTGMPKGKGNQIIVTAPVRGAFAQPYISQIGDVPDARGLDPIQMEVGLQRGVWISGKVVDLESGKPVVDAGIQYMPFDDNEAATQIDRFRQQLVDDYYGHRTDEQGNFRFVAVPGPAVLGPWAVMDSTYPIGQGMEDIPDERKSENGTLKNQFFRGIHPQTTAVKAVDVPLDGIKDLTFELSRGKAIRIKTIDSQGKAIDGVNVAYIPALVGNNFKTGSSEFEATGFLPGKPRTVVFRHNEKRIGAIISISADEAASPFVVTLQPFATVTAKLQEADGSPSSGTALSFDLLDKNGSLIHGSRLSQTGETRSDKQGNFSASLIPGKYAYSFQSLTGYSGHKKIELTAGKTLDLGTIDVTKKLSVAPPMQPRVSPNKKNGDEDQAPPQNGVDSFQENIRLDAGKDMTVRVVDTDGEIADLFADQKFRLKTYAPGEDEYRLYPHDQSTKAGKTIELGDINVEKLEGIFVSGMAG